MKKILSLFLILALLFSLSACTVFENIKNNLEQFAEYTSSILDNSPGVIWASEHKTIVIEYNNNGIHKGYDAEDSYFLKINESDKKITLYNSEEMLDSQIVKDKRWEILSGSFNDSKLVIKEYKDFYSFTSTTEYTIYNQGRNPINDPDISLTKATKIAKDYNNKTEKFVNIEYKGKENYKGTLCFVFRLSTDNSHGTGEIYVNAKTGEIYDYWSCG